MGRRIIISESDREHINRLYNIVENDDNVIEIDADSVRKYCKRKLTTPISNDIANKFKPLFKKVIEKSIDDGFDKLLKSVGRKKSGTDMATLAVIKVLTKTVGNIIDEVRGPIVNLYMRQYPTYIKSLTGGDELDLKSIQKGIVTIMTKAVSEYWDDAYFTRMSLGAMVDEDNVEYTKERFIGYFDRHADDYIIQPNSIHIHFEFERVLRKEVLSSLNGQCKGYVVVKDKGGNILKQNERYVPKIKYSFAGEFPVTHKPDISLLKPIKDFVLKQIDTLV